MTLRHNAKAKYVRLRMQPNGQLAVTLPRFASERHARDLIDSSRPAIRSWRAKHSKNNAPHTDGERIGQSHTLAYIRSEQATTHARLHGLTIEIMLAADAEPTDSAVQDIVQPYILKALQKEARAFLPRRLRYLADMHGFHYEKIRFGTQKGRWGSCSSNGTISLNVGLMALDPELIDYVLIHELCHTKNMNHSAQFWSSVEQCLPDYKARRKRLKTEQPTVSV